MIKTILSAQCFFDERLLNARNRYIEILRGFIYENKTMTKEEFISLCKITEKEYYDISYSVIATDANFNFSIEI